MKKVLFLFLTVLLIFNSARLSAQSSTLTVADGMETNSHIPIYGLYLDVATQSQVIYPASMLTDIVGSNISAITFYMSDVPDNAWTHTFQFEMGVTQYSDFSSIGDFITTGLTTVYTGTISVDEQFTVTFTTPFLYSGGNLVLSVKNLTPGAYSAGYFYGVVQQSFTGRFLDYFSENTKFIPKTTFVCGGSSTCFPPSNFVLSDLNATSVNLSWTPSGTESAWDIYLTSDETDLPDGNTPPTYSVNDTTCLLQELNSSTHYYVYVRANCGGGDVSSWTSTSFLTSQIPAELPYVCDFEDEFESSQWAIVGDDVNQWVIDTATNNTQGGAYALYISNDSGATHAYSHSASTAWAYRDIDFGTTSAEYTLSFDVKSLGEISYDKLTVYLGTPAEIPAVATAPVGATLLGTYDGDNDWRQITRVVSSQFSGVQRLYLLWENDASMGTNPPAAVDNISIEGASCGKPYNVAVAAGAITETSITFHFTPALVSDGAWEAVILAPGETTDDVQVFSLSDTTHTFTGLMADTPYRIRVRTNCGTEVGDWTDEFHVRTECPQYMPIPYTENFDTYGASADYNFPACWTRVYTTPTAYPYISSFAPSTAPGDFCFYSTPANGSCAVAPEVDVTLTPINTLTVYFKIKKPFNAGGSGALQVGVMTDPSDLATFTAVRTFSGVEWTETSWYEVELDLADYTGTGSYIALLKDSCDSYTYIDDFSVYVTPTCLKPFGVQVSAITDNSATISWTARGDETSWQVAVVPAGTPVSSVIPESVSSNPFTFFNLIDDTAYDVYVKADCGEGDESDWTAPISFSTRCLPTDMMPYVEKFEGVGSGYEAYPACWDRMTDHVSTPYPYVATLYSSEGAASLCLYSSETNYSLATSQALDLSTYLANSLHLTFKATKRASHSGRLDVGIMTDPSNMSTFSVLKSLYPSDYANTSDWFAFDVPLTAAYETGNVYLAFYAPVGDHNYVYVDEVVLDYQPACSAPSNLTISQVTGASALVSWNPAFYGASDYIVEYSEAGMDNWQTAASGIVETYCLISGLTPLTMYDVRVAPSCATDESSYVERTFSTGCFATGDGFAIGNGTDQNYQIPSRTNYNYSITQQLFMAAEVTSDILAGIKFHIATPTSQSRNWDIYLGNTTQTELTASSYIPTTSHTLVFSGEVPMNEAGWVEIDFNTVFTSAGGNLVLTVDDNTGSNQGSTYFTSHSGVMSLYKSSDGQNFDPTSVSAVTATSKRNNVVFIGGCDSTVTCVAPNLIITEIAAQSITLNWAPGNSEASWEMQYKSDADTAWTSIGIVNSYPYTLDNLTSSTLYQIRMRSECGNEYSDWTTVEAQTVCESIIDLPYIQNFESATGSGSGHFVDCWYRGTNSSSIYPNTTSNQSFSPSYSLYFYGSPSHYCFATTPRFSENILMDGLQISFQARKTADADIIEVGIMSDPTDISTFEKIATLSPSVINTWEIMSVNTDSYTGNGRYVAFRVPQWIDYGIYIDDVTVQEIPFCDRVEDVEVSQITSHSATVSWTPSGSEDAWEVLYAPQGTIDFGVMQPIMVTDAPSYSISNLNASAPYDVAVRTVCDNGENSAWNLVTFRTECGTISSLPYVEGFETFETGSGNPIYCWVRNSTYGSGNSPYVDADYAFTGGKSLRFYSTTATYSAIAMPQLDATIPANTVEVLFQLRSASLDNKLIVGVMTNPLDASTFVGVDTVTVSVENTFEWFNVSLASYTGTGSYIAFRNTTVGAYALHLDDVTLNALPTCPRPYDVIATSTTTDAVQLAWTDTVGSMWDILFGPVGFDTESLTEGSLISGVTTTSTDIQGLAAGVIYEFYVRSVCGDGEVSPWCYLPAVGAPFTYVMSAIADTITSCGMTIVDDGGISGNYSDNMNSVLVIYPEDANSLLSISGTFVGQGTSDYLSIYEGVGVNEERLLQKVVSGTSGTLVTFDSLVSEYGPLTLNFFSSTLTNYEGFVAYVSCVSPPSCRRVLDVEVQTVASTTADLQWTALGTTYNEFNVAVSTQPLFSPDTCTMLFTTPTTNVQLTGLNPNTTYYVMVKADCGGGDESEWSDMVSFMTSANTAQVPYFSDFSNPAEVADWSIYNGTQTNKWHIGTPAGASHPLLYVSNDNGVTNNYTVDSASYVWACRDIDFGTFAEYEFTFKWKAEGESEFDYIDVYIGNPTVPTNSSEIPEGAIKLNETYLNEDTTGTARFVATLDGTYANTVKRLYFLWRNDTYGGHSPAGSIDSISIVGSTCGTPYNLQANNITQTTADITFTPAIYSDVAWEYVCGPAGCDPETLAATPITSTSFQLTGLNHSSAYDLYVRTSCNYGEYSDWSNVVSFFTLCDVISALPYVEDFNSYSAASFTSSAPSDYPDDVMPTCWSFLNRSANPSSSPLAFLTSNLHYVSSGNCLFFTSNSATPIYAVLPEFSYDIQDLQITFKYKNEDVNNYNGVLSVGYMTDPANAATYSEVMSCPRTSTMSEALVRFNSVPASVADGFIAFRYTGGDGNGYYLSIEDVIVEQIPSCFPVLDISVSGIAQTEATIAWTEQGDATSWNIKYGLTGFTQGTVISNVTNPYTLTGLNAATTYDVYVQAACSDTDLSTWEGPLTFTTACDAITTFPYIQGFETVGMPDCWSQSYVSGTTDWFITSGSGSAYSPVPTAHSGNTNVSFSSTIDGTSTYLISPYFDLSQTTDPYLSYWYVMPAWMADQDQLMVYYRTSPTAEWTPLVSHTSDVTDWTQDSLALPNPSATYQIAFKGIAYYGYGIGLDDFVVSAAVITEPCDAPTNVQVSPTETAATVTWTSTASAWVVEYKETSASDWTASPTLTATTYNITGLTASTDYVVRVKAICAATESAWSAEVPFTTLAGDVTTYTITATATGPGSITPSGTVTVQEGSDITFNFTPDAGAEVSSLLVDDVETAIPADNSYTFSAVVANHTIAVAFEEDETGIEELDLDAAVVLYPNPATSHILINVADARFLGAEMQIFDVYGKLIANTTIETLSTQVDVSQLANGMYMVRINANDGMVTKRFVKR